MDAMKSHRIISRFNFQGITATLLVFNLTTSAQLADQGINVTDIKEELRWDATPIQTTTFANGENLSVAEEDWQWINFCSKRKPTVWIKDEGGKKEYYYNFYAVSDPRGLSAEKSILPSVDQIRNNEVPGFPEKIFTKGYLEQDSENEMVPTVPTPGDQYYWTITKHESAAQGEEVAYIFKYSDKTGTLSASTGQFCDGYSAIAFSPQIGKNYKYRDLLPNEFKSLSNELANLLLIEPGLYNNMKYEFNASLRFDSQGLNKSQKFNLNVSNDPSNKKDRITSLYSLDEAVANYFKYPKFKNRPLECTDSIRISIHTVWTKYSPPIKKDSLASEFLPENFRSNFIKAAQMGKALQSERSFIMDVNGDLSTYQQQIIRGFKMRGPMSFILSPIGFGLKTVTSSYSKGYKQGAKSIGVILALITPFAIAAAVNGYTNAKSYADASTPLNLERKANAEQLMKIGAAVYGVSFTTNFFGSLILGSKNKKMEKRINSYMDERYPYGLVVDYDRK
jgi:hypothetical protein